jgi:hypothetical protein
MKPFCRFLVTGISALSLILAILLLAMWSSRLLPQNFWIPLPSFRMHTAHHYFATHGGQNVFFIDDIQLSDHRIIGPSFTDQSAVASFKNQFGPSVFHINWLRLKSMTEPAYFTETTGQISMAGTQTAYGIPYGYFLILFLLLPAHRWLPPVIRSLHTRFTIQPSICHRCGYDLRATPNRCPECGSVPEKVNG